MCTVVAEAVRRNSTIAEWLNFATQVLIAISVEVGDDLGRAFVSQRGTLEGIQNAQQVVAFEAAHGLWVEPAWQMFFVQSHRVLLFTITWIDTMKVMNAIYIFGHIFVTLGTALWLYVHHRRLFGFVRNIVIVTNVIALFIYERFPVAPPRLTTSLTFNHHLFTFQDTVFGTTSNAGTAIGAHVGYNEFSAMPSVHMAWALIVSFCIVLLARPLIAKLLGACYSPLMLVAVVVTGNHYIMDAVGAGVVVVVATSVALLLERWSRTAHWPWSRVTTFPSSAGE